MFVTFEGIDGSGKTTQAALLAEWAAARGLEVVAVREPGGTPLGERVRELLLEGPGMTPWAEATLFAAARAELAERVIRPALARGAWVICDRYIDSSVAFQGGGRGLGLDRIRNVSLFATDGLLPDRTIVLVGIPRAPEVADRIEVEGDGFRAEVANAFLEIARREPERVALVDAAGDVAEVAGRVWGAVGA